jgi:hypothetical protein
MKSGMYILIWFMTTSKACACNSLKLPNWQNVMLERHGRIEVNLVIEIFFAIVLYMKERCLINYFFEC